MLRLLSWLPPMSLQVTQHSGLLAQRVLSFYRKFFWGHLPCTQEVLGRGMKA